MKTSFDKPGALLRLGVAALAGLLMALAFPKVGLAGLAWVAPGLMLAAALGANGMIAFRAGWVAGVVRWLVELYWLLHIPVMKLAPISGWLALSGFLALYSGAWVWLCWKVFPGKGTHPALDSGVATSETQTSATSNRLSRWAALSSLTSAFTGIGWLQRAVWGLSCAALWVAIEMVQSRFLSGFPWGTLGVTQFEMLPLIQIARFTGVYGVAFLIVWFSASLFCAAAMVLRRPENARRWLGEIILPLAVAVAAVVFGLRQFFAPPVEARTLKIALIQPSIPQQWIWSGAESSNRFAQLLQLSERALAAKPDLLVWPEAAAPGFLRYTTNVQSGVMDLVHRHRVWLILGADDADPPSDPRESEGYNIFNSSFLVSPQGELVASYRKRRLVIFGEYIPLGRQLPFIERWTGMGSFTPGSVLSPFRVPDLGFKTSVLICFEDVFPHLVPEYVDEDTDFLLNLTNNGWFGESAAQWQHAATAIFRAIENGLPLVRCANNGLTCWVDARGQMHDVFYPGTKDIYGAGFKIVEVPLLGGQKRAPTFYRRHGDLFGWSCVAWSVLLITRTVVRRTAGNAGDGPAEDLASAKS